MAQLITVRLNKSDQQPLGFRLQGGKDFGTPLVVQKVNGGSAAERAGLQAGDALIRVNTTDVYTLRHQEAQDAIRAGGGNLELTVQRGGGTWRPAVTPTGSLPRPGSRPLGASPAPVTNTSLKATPQPSRAFGSGHNNVAKPFGYMNGNDSVKSIVNKQYNTPVSMYSDKTIAETLSAQTEVLAGGVLGVNFKKNEKTYDSEKSAVFKVLQEAENEPEPVSEATPGVPTPVSGLRHVTAPVTRDPPLNTGGLPPGQNICEDCERLITGVFVRIKDKNLHVECFKCATCGSSLKNQGYYNLNGKLYCDIHAKLVAKQNPPAPNLDPVTVPPGGRLPTNAYSTPLPPLSTNTYTNGSSSMFSPSSNLSGPKPFGSSLGTYSPASLSPRSAPLSPRAPPPVLAPPTHAPAPAPIQTFAPTKNVKSIVWPPPNPPEDEPESETNPNLLKSDLTSLSEERHCLNTNTSNVSDIQIKSTEEIIPPSMQTMEFSSNATSYDSTQMASSTVKSETAIQKQRSEVKQEISSCTVQSFSQQASESEQFSIYQSHIASDEVNKKIQNMERQVRQEHSANILPSKINTGENIPQYNIKNPNVNVSSIKTQPYSEKINQPKISTNQFPMSTKVPKPGTRVPAAKKPFNERPYAVGTSSLNPTPKKSTLQRGSLLEALTIAPDRPYSPLSFHLPSMQYSNLNAEQGQSLVPEVASSAAPPTYNQSSLNQSNQSYTEQCNTQNTGILQSSSQMSAFKPVCKQTFPPPHPEEFSSQVNNPADIDNQNSSCKEFSQSNQETLKESKVSESVAVTSINTTQNYLEQSDKQESSAFARTGSSLHRPDSIQAKVPEVNNPGLLQTSYIPTNLTNKTSLNIKNKDTSESMTFQPVVDETSLRISPARSRPTTPSMINKPAPIIPHYQMNLVTMEHLAPESRLYNPSSTDASRSSTPLARSRSPVPQLPPNTVKAQAPRIKPMTLQSSLQQALYQNTQFSNYKTDDLATTELQTQTSNQFSPSGVQNYIPNQPLVIKDESQSNVEYRAENYNKGDMNIREDSMVNQNYGERQTESQNISEYGNTTVQTTKKSFEEFESARSAKVIEIRKGSLSSGSNQQIETNIKPINNNLKQVFPPPISTMTPPQQNLLDTNDNVVNASKRPQIYQPTPFISGANQGPVCDPTPSTGSSVGAAARGKTFGVSSAPKRGRGVLNKAALPGSRVPLCGSCNGNIRGPFITALGRIWCPEHFICVNTTCRRQLQDIGFVEENGQLYCEFCFEQYIAPPCDKCHNKIKEDCLNAIGKHFHPECFSCVYCGKLFGNNPFFLEDGLPYCEADWNELFTTKCFACGFPVEAGDRCARRTCKDRVSSPREDDLSASLTPARSDATDRQQIMYNSDTVYSTTTFRPVSVSPSIATIDTPSPLRTRKLETPLHFDGGLFSDIRSTDGKLLSKVTVDRVHSSTRRDVTDTPHVYETADSNGNKEFVDDIFKTETITNEDVIKVKFTPVLQELDSLLQWPATHGSTPLNPLSSVEYLNNDYEDLQSYKIVNSLCKQKFLDPNYLETDLCNTSLKAIVPTDRGHSPLANFIISDHLTKIDNYLQESLNICTESQTIAKVRPTPERSPTPFKSEQGTVSTNEENHLFIRDKNQNENSAEIKNKISPVESYHTDNISYHNEAEITKKSHDKKNKLNSVKTTKPGIISTICNMPMHYHAAIVCFLLIVYNLFHQYIKQNYHGKNESII